MVHYNIHIVASKALEPLKEYIDSIKEYNGGEISAKVSGWDYSYTSFAYWSGTEKQKQEPDIILLFDNADFSKIDLKSGKNVGYANMLDNLKTAKLNLGNAKFVMILSKDKEENLDLINEFIKLNILNLYFVNREFRIEEVKEWLFSAEKTLKDNEKYIKTGSSINAPAKETNYVELADTEKEKPLNLKDKLVGKLISKSKIEQEENPLPKETVNAEPIRIIEKENIITEKEYIIKEMGKAYISIYSACSTGKSHTAWNLSYCLGERNYKTTVINLDYGYSANVLFGIDEIYYNALKTITEKNLYKEILEYAWQKGNVSVIARGLGDTEEISIDNYKKIMSYVRTKQDVVIADCRAGYSELLEEVVRDTNIDLMIFDMDLTHFQLNKQLIERLGDLFLPEKTIAVINNCDINTNTYKYVYGKILEISKDFKDIMPISSCGFLSCELMDTGKTPYEEALKKEEYKRFVLDMDNLLSVINAREEIENRSILSKSYKFVKNLIK